MGSTPAPSTKMGHPAYRLSLPVSYILRVATLTDYRKKYPMNTEQADDIKAKASSEVSGIRVYRLSKLADCADPGGDSAGASLLVSVRDSVAELIDYLDADEIERIARDPQNIQWLDDNGRVHEIADGAPDVYTSTRWAEFVDLAAYNEEPFTTDGSLTDIAGVALYMIAERLALALLEDAALTIENGVNEIEGDD